MTNFLKEANPVQRRLIGMGMNLWDSGYTPQSLVRGVGPFGNLLRMVFRLRYFRPRFNSTILHTTFCRNELRRYGGHYQLHALNYSLTWKWRVRS